MERIFDFLAKLHFRFAGTKELSPLEQQVIHAWRDTLHEPEKAILDAQMNAMQLIQRQAGGARLVFYASEAQRKAIPLFANQQPDLHAVDVLVGEPGAPPDRTMRIKIYLNRGRLVSMEYPKRPDRYMEQHNMPRDRLKVLSVVQTASVG